MKLKKARRYMMAKNDKNKKSYSDVESAARDLLKKLSSQYDAENVDREKKMADTLSDIPAEEDAGNERLSTKEFDRIFNKYGADEKETDETPAPENDESFDETQDIAVVESEPVELGQEEQEADAMEELESAKDVQEETVETPAYDEPGQEVAFENVDGVEAEPADEPSDEEVEPEQEAVEEVYDEPTNDSEFVEQAESEPEPETAPAETSTFDAKEFDSIPKNDNTVDDRQDTNVFADRMAGQDTIESFRPSEEFEIQDQTNGLVPEFDDTSSDSDEGEEVFFNMPDTDEVKQDLDTDNGSDTASDTKDTTDTAMMRAFGLDPKKGAEKDDSKKIFDEYSFSSTDEVDTLDGLDTTGDVDVASGADIIKDETEESEAPSYEYTEPSQKKDIFAAFREKYLGLKIKMVIAGLFALLLVVFESLPQLIKSFDIFGGNQIVSVTIDLCLLIACGALVFGQMVKSAQLLFKGKFNGNTVTLFSFIVSIIVTLVAFVSAILGSDTIVLYNFAFAVCAFFSLVFDFLSLRRDVYSFKIVSASEPKSVLAKLNRVDRYAEEKEFGEYMGDYSDVYKIEETDFVSDFFKKKNEVVTGATVLAYLIPLSFILAIVASVVSATVLKNSAFVSVSHGFMAYWFCAPVIALISYAYPMYLGSQRAYSYSSAIVGETTPESNDKISVIAFSDSDAFPPERIKIKSVKVFENYHIENVIYYASSVFSRIGGPLATVFKQATLDSLNSDDVEIKEITDSGIDAFVDGRHIVIGQPSYMESQCFETLYEAGDEDYEGQTNKRILYLACDEVVVAKFYIQYNVSSDFLYIVRHLAREGICVSIRSSDPCIENDILYKNKIDPEEYPVRIIKGQPADEKQETISTSVGSIVSTGSRKGLIKTLLLCDKIMNIRKTNRFVKIAALLIGAVAAGVLLATVGSVSSLYPGLYQMFWMLPVFIVSKIYI